MTTADILSKSPQFLKFIKRSWAPTLAGCGTASYADSWQAWFPAIWVVLVLALLGIALARFLTARVPETKPLLPYFRWYCIAIAVAATVLGIGQLAITNARTAGVLVAVFGSKEKVCSTIADPRQQLACLGVAWTNESFGIALRDKDANVLSLFAKGGWKIGSDAFLGLITSKSYDSKFMQPLISNRSVQSFTFCTDYENPAIKMQAASFAIQFGADRYLDGIAELVDNRSAFADFVAICTPKVIRDHYTARLRTEQARLEKARSASTPEALEACSTNLQRTLPIRQAFERASRFNITDHFVISGETAVLAELNRQLLFGQIRRGTEQTAYLAAIRKACAADAPRPQPTADTPGLRKIRKILAAVEN